jgi:phosphate transport system substrate-binding protein
MRPANVLALVALSAIVGTTACDDAPAARTYGAGGHVRLAGTGATVPRALFAKWADQYALVDPTTSVAYDPEGSGAGVRAAKDRTADFGVSDAPLSDADAANYRDVLHLPVAVESIAVVYALQGVTAPHLQVTEDVLTDLLTGKIAFWDDPQLTALNAAAKLPHTPVRVVFRGDESGSSYVLSEWLSKTTKKWPMAPTRSLTLPVGVAAQRDDGMVARLRANDGTLGYVSSVTALQQHLSTFAVRNPAGRFVSPSLDGMRAAAATAQLPADLRAHPTAGTGDLAYPLCSFTFVLVRADGADAARRAALARFLWWATHDGQKFAPPLGFGALPGELAVRDEEFLRSLRAAGEPAL